MKPIAHYIALAALGLGASAFPPTIAWGADPEPEKVARPADDNVDDVGVKFHGISAKDVKREVPKDVLATMDKYTKDNRDLQYQRQLRNDKTFYSVHYTTKDNKRMFVRVDDKGKLALGPEESRPKGQAAKPDAGKAPATPAPPAVQQQEIGAGDLPANVRKTIEQATAGGSEHKFVKETIGSDVTYFVEYTKDGQRTNARVAADGRLMGGGNNAVATTPTPTPPPAPAPAPAAPAPAPAESEAQLAAAREAAAPYQVMIDIGRLPAEVRGAVEKVSAGATDPLYQRFTRNNQTLYSIHFTTPEGRRNFMAVDQVGKVVIEPQKSNWQAGGKGVKYEVTAPAQIPAEALQQIEQQTQGGSEHLFLTRTGPDGKQSFHVQYTAANGERMELEVNAEGKLVEKPRNAHEQPFTMIERKK